MLTIITGTPGAGKTLFTLERLKKETIPQKDEQQRPIYVNGVPDLDYRYFKANELEDPQRWYELPEGSVIFIDEAQRIFPQRSAQKEVPKKCREFETHRHKGFDVYITTQDANTLDVHLRRLCGRHFHVHRILGREGATVYEYDHYEAKPTGYHEQRLAIAKTPWKYPKKLYERYKSASQHTVKKRTPWKLWALPLLLVAVVAVILYAIDRIKNRGIEDGEFVQEDSISGFLEEIPKGNLTGQVVKNWEVKSRQAYMSLYQPIIPGLQHTAPIYDELWQPKTFPRPYCIIYADELDHGITAQGCKCYTQQVTPYETSEANCFYWARNGWFDQTKEEDKEQRGERGGVEAQPAPARAFDNYLPPNGSTM